MTPREISATDRRELREHAAAVIAGAAAVAIAIAGVATLVLLP